MSKLAIFPASGKLGTSLYTHLLTLVDPSNVVLISRDPSKIPLEYLEKGAIARKADYDSPESLENAFDGVSYLVLISYPSIEHEHRFEVQKKAITAARNSRPGVSHIFYTSLAFGGNAETTSAAHVMQAHLATEEFLRLAAYPTTQQEQKPFSYTAIREAIYSESWPLYTGFPNINKANEVRIPHDGSTPGIAFAKIEDLGEATARLVHGVYTDSPGAVAHYMNKCITLSGPRAWSIAEVIELLSKIWDRDIKIKRVSVEEYVQEEVVQEQLQSHGPGDVPWWWATSFQAIEGGETAFVTGELEELLGREPEGFEITLRGMMS
ncbi:MAG: hypothetical protein Q9169_005903 [Polycauliona sp. 2 TL-2023]